MDDSCGALDNASARRAAELMLSLLLTVCEEEEDRANIDGRESFARPRAAQTRRCFLPARRKEGKRVSCRFRSLAHFFPFQTRVEALALSRSLSPEQRERAHSLSSSLFSVSFESNAGSVVDAMASARPTKVRRRASPRERTRTKHRIKSHRRPAAAAVCIRRCLSVASLSPSLSFSLLFLYLSPSLNHRSLSAA